MNNSMTERRIHDPQCEDAFAVWRLCGTSFHEIVAKDIRKGILRTDTVKCSRERLYNNQKQDIRERCGAKQSTEIVAEDIRKRHESTMNNEQTKT